MFTSVETCSNRRSSNSYHSNPKKQRRQDRGNLTLLVRVCTTPCHIWKTPGESFRNGINEQGNLLKSNVVKGPTFSRIQQPEKPLRDTCRRFFARRYMRYIRAFGEVETGKQWARICSWVVVKNTESALSDGIAYYLACQGVLVVSMGEPTNYHGNHRTVAAGTQRSDRCH